MNKPIKILSVICLIFAILSSIVLRINSGYLNIQPQGSNTPSPIGTSNVPFQLKVFTVSPMPADAAYRYNPIWVQIQDLYGNPARAPKGGLGVSLSSSNPVIGTVPSTIAIPEGRSFTYTWFASGLQAGTITISASAPGLVTGSATMQTIMNTLTKLAVYVTPSTVFADGGTYYIVTVELQDSSGNVSWAPWPGLGVTLFSSNTTVGTTPKTLFFSPGYQYYQTTFTSTATTGTTTIYATCPGMTTGSASVKTIPVNTKTPTKLKTLLGPPKVWASGDTYGYPVYVQLLDNAGVPTKAPSPGVTVSLVSSNSLIGTVPATMTIPTDWMYYRTYFYSTNRPGSTVITASATGYTSSSATMTPNGYVASKLKAYTILPSEFADGSYDNVIWVELQDSSGRPARAPQDIVVSFVSSDPTVGTPQYGTITIGAGNVFGGVWFHSTFKKGTTTITASATGFTSVSTTVKTVGPTPYKIGLYLAPSKVWADSRTYWAVKIVLEDSSGNPVRAPAGGIVVSLTTTSPSIGTVGSPVTIPESGDGTTTWFRSTATAGTTDINAYASGLNTGSASMTTVATPPTPGPTPTKLVIEGRPKFISAGGVYYDWIAVSLRDASDNPARAPKATGVSTKSSDVIVGWTDYNFEIPENDFFNGGVDFQTTFTSGTTTITATARISSTAALTGTMTFTTGEYSPISKSYQFGNIAYLFYKNSFLVVGNTAAAREVMSAAVFEPGLIRAGTLSPTIKTDTLLTTTEKTSSNLIAFGYNNTIRTSYPLGIVVTQNTAWFNISATAEGKSINFTKSDYPSKSVAIVYLKQQGTRAIMFLWGYGWQGTYAAALFMSDQTKWLTYATKHLLFLQWTDANTDGFVQAAEITVASTA